MAEKNTTRIDKWMWYVRIYKTRSISTEACVGGKVKIAGATIKASQVIRQGDIIQVRKGVVKFEYKVLKITEKRMGAKMITDYMKDITPKEELDKLKTTHATLIHRREKGKGRPTKKERRNMDKFRSQS